MPVEPDALEWSGKPKRLLDHAEKVLAPCRIGLGQGMRTVRKPGRRQAGLVPGGHRLLPRPRLPRIV